MLNFNILVGASDALAKLAVGPRCRAATSQTTGVVLKLS
jgi:hypothetical protein